jgi:hypothetical protein
VLTLESKMLSVPSARELAGGDRPALHRRAAGGAAAAVAVEQALGRLALDHGVGDCVGVLLVGISDLADPALQVHAGALLHHVRRLVRRGVEVRRAAERDVIAGGVGLGADRLAGLPGRAADVGLDAADVVTAECGLDAIDVGQFARRLCQAGLGRGVDVVVLRGRLAVGPSLDGGAVGGLDERVLAGRGLDRACRLTRSLSGLRSIPKVTHRTYPTLPDDRVPPHEGAA